MREVPPHYLYKVPEVSRKSNYRPESVAVTSVKIDRAKLDTFRAVAASEQRTVSQQLRWLIDRNIAEAEKAAA